jgi:hypothetical protein
MNISEGAEGREAGVPGGGDAVEDIIGDIHKCIGEALWWLVMDYDVSILLIALLPGPKCL